MMLGFPRPSALKSSREKNKEMARQEEEDMSPEDMPAPPSSRGSRSSKRNSGMFDIGHTQPVAKNQEAAQSGAVQRRTSKRASSQDRHGQVYGDDVPAFRPETPDVTIDLAVSQTSPRDEHGVHISPRRNDPTRYELPLRGSADQAGKSLRDNLSRPRTRTLDERIRNRSPQTSKSDNRKRIGSFQSVSHLPLAEDPNAGSSIGYPMIVAGSGQNSANTSRQRLIQTPPRPLSPAAPSLSPGSPVSDAERILRLMRTTGGRMHGILYYRLSKSATTWQSGYCAINVSTGGLIYQTKGELAQTKTLIPDLRGCKVRTQFDPESQAPFLEMSTRASGLGIHLRPLVPETFDSWLAALLCWQPLKPSGAQHASSLHRQRTWRATGSVSGSASATASGTATPTSSATLGRAPSRTNIRARPLTEIFEPMRSSKVVKQIKILWWDLAAPQSAPIAPPRRISTYKQMRMSAGAPWRKAVATVRENGLLEVVLEGTKDKDENERVGALKAAVDTTTLTRFAIQRLHPSVLDDEFCLAVYTQYRHRIEGSNTGQEEDEAYSWPIFLSFESRMLFELWYTMLRAFTVPEIYGAGAKALFANHLKPQFEQAKLTGDMFRVKRSLNLRVIEAQVHVPKTSGQAIPETRTTSGEDLVSGDYHAEVQIGGEIRGRTSLQTETSNPFWREDYEFTHLPPLTGYAHVLLKSRQAGQRDWTLISDERYTPEDLRDTDHLDMIEDIHISPLDSLYGTVELNLAELERGTDIEKWWTIRNEYEEAVGRMFMRVRLDEAVILMSSEYEELADMLKIFSSGLATDVMDKSHDSSGRMAETLLNIFQVGGLASRWIMSMVEDEIDSLQRDVSASRYRFSRRIASNDSYDSGVERELVLRDMGKSASVEANLLFRGNTPLTKALELHMRRLGKEYLEEVLGERLRDIDESEPECEVDPNKIHSPEALQRNWRNLILLTESIWRSVRDSAKKCPPELRQLFRHIRACTEDRYGAFLRTVSYSSVSAFMFLRLLVPAILNPSLFGLLKELPRPKSRRTLTMIAKSLQTLANMTTFGAKEPWMEPMNAFLNSHRQEFKDFIDDICSISQDGSADATQIPREYSSALRMLESLPTIGREGAPSLPYLIDQPREYATLVSLWVSTRRQAGSIPIVNEDLARFDVTCNRLREATRGVLMKAAEDGPVDASGNDWQRLLVQLDSQNNNHGARRSGMVSPISPTPAHVRESSISSQPTRPTASRTSTTHSNITTGETPGSAKTPFGFTGGPLGDTGLNSPSAGSFAGSKRGEDDEDDDDDATEGPDKSGTRRSSAWVSSEQNSAQRDRAGTLPNSAASAGFITHPLAWSEPGSAGSGRSKTSSLRSIDTEAANGGPGMSSEDRGSSALPWSVHSEDQGPSPMTSPRDHETRKFMDVLGFRRNKKDKPEKEREKEREKEESKKAKRKEKEKKKQGKEKDRGKDRGRDASPADPSGLVYPPESHRDGYEVLY